MSRIICLVGGHPLSKEWAVEQFDCELWCANESGTWLGDLRTRIFQLHPRNWREDERKLLYGRLPKALSVNSFGRSKEHVKDLQACGIPIYGQRIWPDIPTCVRYPFEEVTEAVGIDMPPNGIRRLWATSTFGYMMALLLTEHLRGDTVAEVRFAGIELPNGTLRERTWEYPNFAYYVGMARAFGITIGLPPAGSTLFNAPPYALGFPNFNSPDFWMWPAEPYRLDFNADGTYHVERIDWESYIFATAN